MKARKISPAGFPMPESPPLILAKCVFCGFDCLTTSQWAKDVNRVACEDCAKQSGNTAPATAFSPDRKLAK